MQLSTSHTAAIAILENSQLQNGAPSNEERARGLPIQLNLHVMLSGDFLGIFFVFVFCGWRQNFFGGGKKTKIVGCVSRERSSWEISALKAWLCIGDEDEEGGKQQKYESWHTL